MTWNFTPTDTDKLDADTDQITDVDNARDDLKAAVDNINLMIAESVPVTDEANVFDGGIQTFTTLNTPIELKAKSSNGVYIPLFPNTALPTTRLGRMGFVGGIDTLTLENEAVDGDLNLKTNGGGDVQANASRVLTALDIATHASFVKAWIWFSGVTMTINGSYNIDSIVDLGTGKYRIVFTIPFATGQYLTIPENISSIFVRARNAYEVIGGKVAASSRIELGVQADSGAVGSFEDSNFISVLFMGVQ